MNDNSKYEDMYWKKGVQYLDESITPKERQDMADSLARSAREFSNRMKAIAAPLVRNYNASKRNTE